MKVQEKYKIRPNLVAEWKLGVEYEYAYCSHCGYQQWASWDTHREAAEMIGTFHEKYKFCPNCGAKMEGGVCMSNSQDVGNEAAMREALTKVSEWMAYRIATGGFEASPTIPTMLEDVVLPALAAPPRNCDRFNTGNPMKDAEDAYDAWQRYCDDPTIPPSCKVESAFRQWIFATATEKKGETDGTE